MYKYIIIIALLFFSCKTVNTERLIKIHSSKKITVNIIKALITIESDFNSKAKSHKGARGLMQIMPKTAKWLCNIDNPELLYKPDINIKCGTVVLNYYLKRAKWDIYEALRFYNAGEKGATKYKLGHKYAVKVLTVKQYLDSKKGLTNTGRPMNKSLLPLFNLKSQRN